MTTPARRIAAVAAETAPAQEALQELCRIYPCVPPERAEVIVPLGGDARQKVPPRAREGAETLGGGAELRIRMVLTSQSKDRDEPAAVLCVIDEIEPVLAS